MEVNAIFAMIISLVMGSFFIILGILALRRYIKTRKGSVTSIILHFIFGIIGIYSAILGYISLLLVIAIIIIVVLYSYSRYMLHKHPEIKENREEYLERIHERQEEFKKTTTYKILKITKYVMLCILIFMFAFILIVVLFNVTF